MDRKEGQINMNQKYFPAPDEVVRVAGKQSMFQTTAEYGMEVWSAELVKMLEEASDRIFTVYSCIHAVFVAGYLAPKRGQRDRARKQN